MNEQSATITLEQYDKFKEAEQNLLFLKNTISQKDAEIFNLAKLNLALLDNWNNGKNSPCDIFEDAGFSLEMFLKTYDKK